MELREVESCLHCKNALCSKFCPINTQCGTAIQLCQNGQVEQAQQLLFANNFFSAICAIVCDHKKQCFGHCVLNFKGNPVPFYKLEQQISLDYIKNYHPTISQESKDTTFCLIGGGVANMTLAFLLASDGYKVSIVDNHETLGGVIMHSIPSYRLSKDIVDNYVRILQELNVNFINNTYVDETNIDYYVNSYDKIVLGIGAWIGKELANSKDYDFVYKAVDVLDKKITFPSDSKIIVLGGGNVAMDAATYCKRQAKDTSIYYRKEIKDMPANVDEVAELATLDIKVEQLAAPIGFYDKGIIFAKGETIVDENGKKQTKIVENSEYKVECDYAILAISQSVDNTLFKYLDLQLNKWGMVDSVDGTTNKDNIYISGDALLGPATVVQCVNQAKKLYNIICQ